MDEWMLAVLRDEDRPPWAAAFYAGLRRGELQALGVCDVDLGASLIRVEPERSLGRCMCASIPGNAR